MQIYRDKKFTEKMTNDKDRDFKQKLFYNDRLCITQNVHLEHENAGYLLKSLMHCKSFNLHHIIS